MVHNVEFSCSHISFVWLHGLNSLQWWLLTCPDLTNVVWFKNNIDQHEYPKQLQAHPAKKSEIPDTRNTRWFWKKIGYGLGIAKNYRVGSGIGYPSGTACKHRAIVSINQHLPSFDLVPEDNPEMRRMWMFIGTGKYVDLDYFRIQRIQIKLIQMPQTNHKIWLKRWETVKNC